MSAFIDACYKRSTNYTPIWLMRQAGRYQPEYRVLRSKVSFVELCKRSDLAAEVTLLPVRQFGFDAAIVFADILLILEPLGVDFEFAADHGPQIKRPIRLSSDVDAIADNVDAAQSLSYVMQTIRLVVTELGQATPLIGFSGAPFTLAAYLIEGGSSRNYALTKSFMYSDPAAWDVLMRKLVAAIVSYLRAQTNAGAAALQVFDSWVGCLSLRDYQRFVMPYMQQLFEQLGQQVPVIHFSTGNASLYPLMKQAGGEVMGVDWRVDLGKQWDVLGDVAIMGNLDPVALLGPLPELRQAAQAVLDAAQSRPGHIFNLGHGVLPQTPIDQVRALVDYVHEKSQRRTP
ncbi:MAG: uroporphyrinogen decarboxylase [Myxococcales bacterium]|nr:uroporphyrinogen decarboxylase [Myxococcales bacterium]